MRVGKSSHRMIIEDIRSFERIGGYSMTVFLIIAGVILLGVGFFQVSSIYYSIAFFCFAGAVLLGREILGIKRESDWLSLIVIFTLVGLGFLAAFLKSRSEFYKNYQKRKKQEEKERFQRIEDDKPAYLNYRIHVLEKEKESYKGSPKGIDFVISSILDHLKAVRDKKSSYGYNLGSKGEKEFLKMFEKAEAMGEFNRLLKALKAHPSKLVGEYKKAQKERLEEEDRKKKERTKAAPAKIKSVAEEVLGNPEIDREEYKEIFLNHFNNKILDQLFYRIERETGLDLSLMPRAFISFLQLLLFSQSAVEFEQNIEDIKSEAEGIYEEMGSLALDYAYLMLISGKVDFFKDFWCIGRTEKAAGFVGYAILIEKIIKINADSLGWLASDSNNEGLMLGDLPFHEFVMLYKAKASIPVQLESIIGYIFQNPYKDVPTGLREQVMKNVSVIRDPKQYDMLKKGAETFKEQLGDSEYLDKMTSRSNNIYPLQYVEAFKKQHGHEPANSQVIKYCLTQTPLESFFFASLPFSIPFEKRFEHCHICAGSGHGKTQLLLSLIYNDIQKAKKGKGGFCVIDSQGDLIDTISLLSEFDPAVKDSLADKLIIVDPTDIDHPTALNMFDVDMERIRGIKDPSTREMAINATISLYEYIFSDLIGGGLTLYQKNIYNFGAKLLLNISGANILTFVELLQDGQQFRQHFNTLDGVAQQFFETEYFTKKYAATKEQIATRLWNILSNQTFQRMFGARENKIDLFAAMNTGKIILINTAKSLLQEDRCRLLGRFFIAMILQATYQRATVPEDRRKSFFVYIDEAQDYLNDTVAEFLSQARKYKVGVIIAHQYLTQLDNVSRNLKASVLANTAIKLMGKVELSDAKVMADRMRVKPDDLLDLVKKDQQYTEFLCHLQHITQAAVKIKVKLGVVNRKPQMTTGSFEQLRNEMRAKYSDAAGSGKKNGTGQKT